MPINQMYGIEYEVRKNSKIAEAISNKTEIYILAYIDDECVGFSRASLNNDYYADIITPDIAVIDYIYTLENKRNLNVSFELISKLLKELVNLGVKQAIMQFFNFIIYLFNNFSDCSLSSRLYLCALNISSRNVILAT